MHGSREDNEKLGVLLDLLLLVIGLVAGYGIVLFLIVLFLIVLFLKVLF